MKIKSLIINNKLLFIILFIAALLRLWNLGSIPPSLSPDEAAIGYNAYSILKTAKDEHNQLLPIVFKSFGDYKPGLYIYTTVPFVLIFGLNEWSVRLSSAIAGIMAVWLIYLLTNELKSYELRVTGSKNITYNPITRNFQTRLIAAFLLAINPWHIYFSRGAWEANLSLTLTLFGIYFFLKALNKHKYLLLSAISLALTLLTYQGAKLSSVIVIFLLLIVFWPEFKKILSNNFVTVLQSIILSVAIVMPILISLFTGKIGRLEVFSVFSYPRENVSLQTFLAQGNEKVGDIKYIIYHSESLNFARGILERWYNHFSGKFLLFAGDWSNPRHSAPNQGMFLLIDLVLLPLGLILVLKNKPNKFSIFFIAWLVLAPLPAILSRNQVHAVRSLNMIIPLTLISSMGFSYLLLFVSSIKRYLLRITSFLLLAIIFICSLVYFFDAYFVHLPAHDAILWDYGYKEMVKSVVPVQDNYAKVFVQQSYDQPYIYFLFYGSQLDSQRYDPRRYQMREKLVESSFGDVGLVEDLDNISFQEYNFPQVSEIRPILVVGDSNRISDDYEKYGFNLIKEIKYPGNVDTAFYILDKVNE